MGADDSGASGAPCTSGAFALVEGRGDVVGAAAPGAGADGAGADVDDVASPLPLLACAGRAMPATHTAVTTERATARRDNFRRIDSLGGLRWIIWSLPE